MTTQSTGGAARVRIPDELHGSIPRAVRLTRGGVVLTVIAVTMAAAAVAVAILLSIGYERQQRQRELRTAEAVTAQAEVVNVRVTRGDNRRRILTYRYEVGGLLYTGSTSFGERAHRDIEAGSMIDIGYLPSSPGASWMVGHEPGGIPLVAIILIPLGLAAGAAAIAFALRRQWMLLMEGRPALARVTEQKRVRHDKHQAYRVSFEFETLSGARRTGSFDVGRNPPAVGAIVPIIYDRDNPARTAKYPMQLVRPERAPDRVR